MWPFSSSFEVSPQLLLFSNSGSDKLESMLSWVLILDLSSELSYKAYLSNEHQSRLPDWLFPCYFFCAVDKHTTFSRLQKQHLSQGFKQQLTLSDFWKYLLFNFFWRCFNIFLLTCDAHRLYANINSDITLINQFYLLNLMPQFPTIYVQMGLQTELLWTW